jgi:Phosphotransferase enzyme family
MHALPSLSSFEAFQAWRADASQCLPVALDIARSHGLTLANPQLFLTGTNLVVGIGQEFILKIFPPMLRGQFVSERIALSQLRGRLSVRIPEIVFEGERDQWPYLVITRLPGILGTVAWPALPEDQKERVLGQVGETIAEVQLFRWESCPASSRAGTDSWLDKLRDVAPGTSVSGCRENIWTGWTNFFAMRQPSFHWTHRGSS